MAHDLPLVGTKQRDMFDVADLVAIATGDRAPTDGFLGAKAKARRTFALYAQAAACPPSRLCYIVLEGDDRLSLVSVGPRGGLKREWTFGYGLKGQGKAA